MSSLPSCVSFCKRIKTEPIDEEYYSNAVKVKLEPTSLNDEVNHATRRKIKLEPTSLNYEEVKHVVRKKIKLEPSSLNYEVNHVTGRKINLKPTSLNYEVNHHATGRKMKYESSTSLNYDEVNHTTRNKMKFESNSLSGRVVNHSTRNKIKLESTSLSGKAVNHTTRNKIKFESTLLSGRAVNHTTRNKIKFESISLNDEEVNPTARKKIKFESISLNDEEVNHSTRNKMKFESTSLSDKATKDVKLKQTSSVIILLNDNKQSTPANWTNRNQTSRPKKLQTRKKKKNRIKVKVEKLDHSIVSSGKKRRKKNHANPKWQTVSHRFHQDKHQSLKYHWENGTSANPKRNLTICFNPRKKSGNRKVTAEDLSHHTPLNYLPANAQTDSQYPPQIPRRECSFVGDDALDYKNFLALEQKTMDNSMIAKKETEQTSAEVLQEEFKIEFEHKQTLSSLERAEIGLGNQMHALEKSSEEIINFHQFYEEDCTVSFMDENAMKVILETIL